MTTETDYHKEWLRRKAKRVLKQARNARHIKTIRHKSGRVLEVYTAERSRGYQTNYERVATFYLLIYEDGELIHGQTMTQREWQKYEPELVKIAS